MSLWAEKAWSDLIAPSVGSQPGWSVHSAGQGNGELAGFGRDQRTLHSAEFRFDSSRLQAEAPSRGHAQAGGPNHAAGAVPSPSSLGALEARRDLNPARFDHFHPFVGPVVGEIARLQAGLCPASDSKVNALLARRLINPARFDHYHPVLGPLLATDYQLRAALCESCHPLNGILPTTALYNDLRWRRSLNPARFDRFHPTLGRLLHEDQLIRSGLGLCQNTLIPQIVQPPGDPGGHDGGNFPPTPPPPPPPNDETVPEPSALILLLVGASSVAALCVADRFPTRRRTRHI